MSRLKRQLTEDRAMRDAARSVLATQAAAVRKGVSGEKIGADIADKFADPAIDELEEAGLPSKMIAAAIAGAAAVVGLALAWKPVLELLQSSDDSSTEEADDAQ